MYRVAQKSGTPLLFYIAQEGPTFFCATLYMCVDSFVWKIRTISILACILLSIHGDNLMMNAVLGTTIPAETNNAVFVLPLRGVLIDKIQNKSHPMLLHAEWTSSVLPVNYTIWDGLKIYELIFWKECLLFDSLHRTFMHTIHHLANGCVLHELTIDRIGPVYIFHRIKFCILWRLPIRNTTMHKSCRYHRNITAEKHLYVLAERHQYIPTERHQYVPGREASKRPDREASIHPDRDASIHPCGEASICTSWQRDILLSDGIFTCDIDGAMNNKKMAYTDGCWLVCWCQSMLIELLSVRLFGMRQIEYRN